MPKYINVAKQLVRLYRLNLDCEDVIKEFLVTAEPEDVVERKKGKWISRKNESKHKDWWTCSECQGRFDYEWKFCPNCGADMREEMSE